MEKTFVIIKPEAVTRGLVGEILKRFEQKRFTLERLQLTQIEPDLAREHYSHLSDKPFFGGIIDSITSGPVVMAIVAGPDVIKQVRNIVGATNPVEAAPGSIRGDFATALPDNLVHASDSPETAEQEIQRFFGS